eukprot:131885_1
MADLSIIGYVIHWIILIILCRRPLYLLLMFTSAVYFTCFLYVLTDDYNYDNIGMEDWFWFQYAKRISLVVGYLAYVWVYTTNSKASRIFVQWALALNVLEAGLLALQYLEIVSGVLLIVISPFSPQYFINEENKTLLGKPGNLFQRERFNYLSVKWYMRCHLIILGVWYITSDYFNTRNESLFTFLSCVIPLAANEYCFDNFVNHFSIRAFALIISIPIYASIDTLWIKKQPSGMIPDDNLDIILRNCIQLLVILFLFGLVVLNDKLRGNKGEEEATQEERATHIGLNEEYDSEIAAELQSLKV